MVLPVTLLSGFLGAGKTTLLQHILKNKQNLRCAVIVNDMAELNIDAELVKKNSILQKEEKLLEMQNGCICCTLREDLLIEIAELAKSNTFDYLIIESTGISEPMQVAETFTFALAEEDEGDNNDMTNNSEEGNTSASPLVSLQNIARLDTCVTVIDAVNFFSVFETADTVSDTQENTHPDDERTLSELMCDQIEFSNVILLNKIDLIDKKKADDIFKIIKKLNPEAEIHTTRYSAIDLTKILNTGKFDFAKAANSPGWLQSIREELKPETEEYGVSSFVYRRRLPFHPIKFWELISKNFLVQQADINETEPEEEEEEEEEEEDDGMEVEDDTKEDDEIKKWIEDVKKHRMKKDNPFTCILRSKGFLWLADRNQLHGEWSQAGLVSSIGCGGPWFCEIPRESWPKEAVEGILKDFDPKTKSDRRQEIVFIGQISKENKKKIIEALDECLVQGEYKDENETKKEEGIYPWPSLEDYMMDNEEDNHEGHHH